MTREEAIKNLKGKTERARVLLKTIPESVRSKCELNEDIEAYELAIEALQERPKGRWKHGNCTECGLYVGETTCRHYSYCPNCGAEMRGEE